ncbi:MAG: ribosome silencing factor [Anaerolineae bacterium]|nr:ribosome silencing factor [Anaerolineae bacterium]
MDLARYVVALVEDKKAENILLLDLRKVTIIADFFIICSAQSDRQLKTIVETVSVETKREHGILPHHIEGEAENGWVLIDYGVVVVHAFTPETRSYYDLEGFWREATVVVSIQ